MYHDQYMDVLNQINTENALAEDIRQFNASNSSSGGYYYTGDSYESDNGVSPKKATGTQKSMKGVTSKTPLSSTKGSMKGVSKEVSTEYYQGTLNADAKKFGTFSNGYQPKGISGHGTLKKTGDYTYVSTAPKYGANKGVGRTVKQNVWKAEDGTLWYWQGLQNKYIQLK